MEKYSLKRSLILMASIFVVSSLAGSYVYASQPKDIVLNVDGRQVELYTSAATLQDALEEAGFTNLEELKSSEDLDRRITNNMKADIITLKKVNITVGGKAERIETYATSVGELLEENKIKVDEDDVISPARKAAVTDGMNVQVDFYKVESVFEEKEIPYEEVSEDTSDLYVDETEISQEGENGIEKIETKRIFKNGELEKEEVGKKEVIKKPITQIVKNGTKEYPVRSSSSSSSSSNSGSSSSSSSSSSTGAYSIDDFEFAGVVNWDGKTFTYYSESVLPGEGLNIPGRHTSEGFVRDGDGYIVLASDYYGIGTVISTPFGSAGKVYDCFGGGNSADRFDVYTR